MAGILSRARDILASNINAALDKCENPEKMIDQLLRDARANLAEVKKESANVIAQESASLRALEKERADVIQYTNAAKAALSAGNEADAMVLAERIAKEQAEVVQAEKVYDMCKANADNMRALYRKLTADVEALDGKRANLKALVSASKAQESVNKAVSVTGNGVGAKIADYEAKIQQRFDAAQASASLDAEVGGEAANLLGKYSRSESGNNILEQLKAEMGISAASTTGVEDADTILLRLKGAEIVQE